MKSGRAKAPLPRRVVLELSADCNLACPMCPRRHVDGVAGFMDGRLWKRCVDEVARFSPGAVLLPFWRGESLLHPHFGDLLRYALDLGLPVHISTNGHLVEGETAKLLARCEFVTFSVHSEAGYKRALAFAAGKGGGTTVQASFVRGEETERKHLPGLLAAPGLAGFDGVRLYDEHSRDGVFGRASRPPAGKRRSCPKLEDTIVIAWDGQVSRCNHLWTTEGGLAVGEGGIAEIWRSDVMNAVRAAYPDDRCGPCDQWSGHTCGESWKIEGGKVVAVALGGGERDA